MNISKVVLNKDESKSYTVEQSFNYDGDDYWEWSIWIASVENDKLDKIGSVTYHLHNTFPNPVRIVKDRKTNFRLDSGGWGIFTIYIVLNLKDDSVIELKHKLDLEYPDGLEAEKRSVKKK